MPRSTNDAGQFPLTIEIWSRKDTGTKNASGHAQFKWLVSGRAAARRWSMTNDERTQSPVEYQSRTLRLLCRACTINTNQQVRYDGQLYRVTASESRDLWDCLITLEPITR